jgi:hypothetical protein
MSEKIDVYNTCLRLPKPLAEKVKTLAERSGLSFNAFIIKVLENCDCVTIGKRVEILEARVNAMERAAKD